MTGRMMPAGQPDVALARTGPGPADRPAAKSRFGGAAIDIKDLCANDRQLASSGPPKLPKFGKICLPPVPGADRPWPSVTGIR
jgi:hypothetical protein